jgi:hypothetical protein
MKILMILFSLNLFRSQSCIIQDLIYLSPVPHSNLFRNCLLDYMCAVGNEGYLELRGQEIDWQQQIGEEQLYVLRKMLHRGHKSYF